jgi:5-methylcytosine-specific restriction enzyme subunit McrC
MRSNASLSVPEVDSVRYTEYGIPIRNLWHMCLYAWSEVPLNRHWTLDVAEDAPTLDALLASILAGLIQQRLRIGLGRSYINESQLIRGIRGRIDFSESLKRQAFEHGQSYCEFQEYSANSPKNQIIRSTLARLVQVGDFGTDHVNANELRHTLRVLTRALDGIDLVELKPDFIRRQHFGRNDADYRLMLNICELILLRQMPSEQADQLPMPTIDRDALVLHNIYERFVANFYRIHLHGWKVARQKQLNWHDKSQSKFMPSLRPDIVLEENSTRRLIILDTKFTAQSLVENQWGDQIFDSSHLYQLYAYLRTQEHLSESHQLATGILLYPSIQHKQLSEKIEFENHTIRVESVDLTSHWQDIEQRLLDVIG